MNACLCPVKSISRLPPDLAKDGSVTAQVDGEVFLRAGEVLVLRRPGTIRVLKGTVWITETPAAGDVLLHAGGRLMAKRPLPLVVEALTVAEIVLE